MSRVLIEKETWGFCYAGDVERDVVFEIGARTITAVVLVSCLAAEKFLYYGTRILNKLKVIDWVW